MKHFVVLPFILCLTSCAVFGQTPQEHLALIQQAAISSRLTIRPVIDQICKAEAENCARQNQLRTASFILSPEEECPGLALCDKVRTIIIKTLEALQFAITDANTALAIGDEARYEEAVGRAAELLLEVRRQLMILGIVPGEE
jgi:hypothetical protein